MSSTTSRDYLAEFDSAAEAERYPLVKEWIHSEPLPFFKQLREERPILVTPVCTLVARFVDVRDVLLMPKILTVDLYKSKMGVTDKDVGYLMAHDDDALHYREKSIMQGMLNRDDIPRVRSLVARTASTILDQAGGRLDIVDAYCRGVPATLVQEYFGLDGVDNADLIRWSYWNQVDAFHNQPMDLHSPEKTREIIAKREAASKELASYLAMLIARKLVAVKAREVRNFFLIGWYALKSFFARLFGKKPEPSRDDVVSRLLASSFAREVDFSLERLAVNVSGLLIGAVETTSQSVAQVIAFFIERPELMEKAKAAARHDDPAEFDGMVWEALRFVAGFPYIFRKASEECSLARGTEWETKVPEGTIVLALIQSAMFDSYAFADPDSFIADRNRYHDFTFGFGSHECLGKHVGRVMLPEMVRQVLLRDVKAVSPIDYKDGPLPESYVLQWSESN